MTRIRPPSPARRAAPRRKVDPQEGERQQWQDLALEENPGKLQPYAMDASFKKAARISHPTFGVGLVVGLPGPKKVEVLFKEGKKVLRCA